MIEEGEDAPTFELPAVCDGAVEQVALSDHLDDQVVILVFYPGDFNPACERSQTGLDELDLFTMQKDVSILALSGDSVYSHTAFADEFDLHIPLLADVHGRIAEEYGVAVEDDTAGHLTQRAVVVVDHRGVVEYTWRATEPTQMPDVDAIRTAVNNVGDDDSAFARYRVGHAHYIEGRRAFTSAMQAYDEKEWMMSKGDFDTAFEEFSEAEDEFNTAVRFAEDETNQTYFERAERKAESLWRAAEWLSDSANAYASGKGGKAQSLRADAESPLENARAVQDPTPPDEFPPEEGQTDDEAPAGDRAEEDDVSLDLETDEQAESPVEDDTEKADSESEAAENIQFGIDEDDAEPQEATNGTDQMDEREAEPEADTDDAAEEEDDIDDEELEEIAAELEQQTEAAQEQTTEEVDDGNVVSDSIDVGQEGETDDDDSQANGEQADAADSDDGDIELDLTDPTEDDPEEDEDEEEVDTGSFGSGDHGVPDSL